MARLETIVAVKDVAKSSQWYQKLLGCRSAHGGDTFEILKDDSDTVLLCLHKWGEHEHPTLTSPSVTPGNGLILYFRVNDLQKAWQNAVSLTARIEQNIHHNPNSHKDQFTLRDPDGYYIIVSL